LTGGAQARNIFWQVGSSATIGTSSVFKGTIMAYASISMNASSTLDGRALAQNGAVTFNGDGGDLPRPSAPVFTSISRTPTNSVVVLNTSPYFFVSLQSNPGLSPANWTLIATNTPVANLWTITNNTGSATQLFYRAFITPPN
jgi:type VI secretion system secreted protein VgrG